MREPRALTQEPPAGVPRPLLRWWGVVPVLIVVALFALRAWLHVEPVDRLAIVAGEPADPPGTVPRAGSIYVARGGPVIMGFWSPASARVAFAGRHIVGRGLVKIRVVVPEGAAPIRFAAPAGARLLWNPVGRRGEPEYVPASSLSPDGPATASFESPGVSTLDGVIALGLLLTVVATLCILARRRLAAVPRATWLAMAIVFGAGLAVRGYDLGGFGQTWDEDVNWTAGRNYVTNVVALDASPAAWQWNFEHPPVMKLLDGIGAQLTDSYTAARVLSAIWLALGCALLVPIGARLFRPRVGVLAAAIATLLPPMVAHGQIVGHESPTVLWWALGVLLALGVHDDLPSSRAVRTLITRLAWVGVVVGIATASRFINGLLGVLCAAIVVVQAPQPWRRATLRWAALVMPIATILAFYAVWPRLWLHPFASLGESFHRLDNVHAPEPFLGTVTNRPGPHYFLVYLYATTPLAVLVGVTFGAVRLARARGKAALICAAWLVVPLGVAASPVRQDGVRYVMPCLLALSLIAAAGLDQLALWARLRHAFTGITVAIVAYLGFTLARVHPYYLDYFAEQVGGAGNVERHGWFETAWWGEGVDRAVAYVNTHAAPNARVHRACILPGHLAWFRADLWTPMTDSASDATWIVHYNPSTQRCPRPADARKVFAVTSDGVELAAVYQR